MDLSAHRRHLLSELVSHGIHDPRVLRAIEEVPRTEFVPESLRGSAYEDRALPIGAGQTISQPYMVALMTQELGLAGGEKVLEIGTGSGYQAAILARLSRSVVTIERLPELSERAAQVLSRLGFHNVEFHVADGSLGWPPAAPYDRILVTAGAPDFPHALYDQLTDGGRLVVPVGRDSPLILQTITKHPPGPQIHGTCECSFVPLIGEEGWPDDAE